VTTAPRPPSLGLSHAALSVRDLASVEQFFVRVLGYEVASRPDPENVYLRRDHDDVALHRAADAGGPELVDHLDGIFVARAEDVDTWERWLDAAGAEIAARSRTHQDGVRSLYAKGPEGIVVQILHHPRALAALAR
jgi:catechol 2,3-dioxygenase-like lactoylglutathione lyase family enzyme